MTPSNGTRWVAIVGVGLAGLLLTAAGCAEVGYGGNTWGPQYSNRVVLSADGTRAAWVWTDRWYSLIPLYMTPLAEAKSEYVGYQAPGPDGRAVGRAVQIDSRWQIGGYGNSPAIVGLAFSPDGAHVAALLEDHIEVIDVPGGGRRRIGLPPGGGTLCGVCWVDPATIAFERHLEPDPKAQGCQVELFRQAIAPGSTPVRLLSEASSVSSSFARAGIWSPDGQMALLVKGGLIRLLHLTDGRVDPVTDLRGKDVRMAAWKPDSSAILCLYTHQTAPDPSTPRPGMILIDPRKLAVTDLTRIFNADANLAAVWWVEWTRDGRYLLTGLSAADRRFLICPQPWEVIELKEDYRKPLPDGGKGLEIIQAFQPGWLAVGPVQWWAQDQPPGMTYAVDYAGRRCVPLTGHPFGLSADGRRIVEVTGKDRAVIRDAIPAPLLP